MDEIVINNSALEELVNMESNFIFDILLQVLNDDVE